MLNYVYYIASFQLFQRKCSKTSLITVPAKGYYSFQGKAGAVIRGVDGKDWEETAVRLGAEGRYRWA